MQSGPWGGVFGFWPLLKLDPVNFGISLIFHKGLLYCTAHVRFDASLDCYHNRCNYHLV